MLCPSYAMTGDANNVYWIAWEHLEKSQYIQQVYPSVCKITLGNNFLGRHECHLVWAVIPVCVLSGDAMRALRDVYNSDCGGTQTVCKMCSINKLVND